MFRLLDDIVDTAIKTASRVVNPVTELVGISGKDVAVLLAAGYTIYEISELTGLAVDVIHKLGE